MDYVGAIIKQKGKFLLQLRDNRKNIPHPNKWATFGGGIKEKESPLQALKRELKEEIGLKKINPKIFFEISIKGKGYFIYKINLDNQSLKLMEGQKIGRFSLFQILFKRNLVTSVRLFFIIYPFLKIFNRN